MPHIDMQAEKAANAIIAEVERYVNRELSPFEKDDMRDVLTRMANKAWDESVTFRNAIGKPGGPGKEMLAKYMRHWLGLHLKNRGSPIYEELTTEFTTKGRALSGLSGRASGRIDEETILVPEAIAKHVAELAEQLNGKPFEWRQHKMLVERLINSTDQTWATSAEFRKRIKKSDGREALQMRMHQWAYFFVKANSNWFPGLLDKLPGWWKNPSVE